MFDNSLFISFTFTNKCIFQMSRIENYFSHGKKVSGTPFKNSQGKNKFKMRFSWLFLSNFTLTNAAGKFNINSNLC